MPVGTTPRGRARHVGERRVGCRHVEQLDGVGVADFARPPSPGPSRQRCQVVPVLPGIEPGLRVDEMRTHPRADVRLVVDRLAARAAGEEFLRHAGAAARDGTPA